MTSRIDDERLCFIVDWYEKVAARIRQFRFFYFVETRRVELYDIKTRSMFLKTVAPDLTMFDLYLENKINVCSRQFMIVDFGDEYTRKKLGSHTEKTLGLIKPETFANFGQILEAVYERGFLISRLRTCFMERELALKFYHEHVSKPYINNLLECILSGPVVVLELVGTNVMEKWRQALGPRNPIEARAQAPGSIRAQFGSDEIYNGVHGSSTHENATIELELLFPPIGPAPRTSASVKNSTLCIIKPSVFKEGLAAKILMAISEANFTIGAAQLFSLGKANAEEFLQVYKGVAHEYPAMVDELTSGPCLALEITGPEDGPPVVPAFKELCGPSDPEIARHLRPKSIRAVFGRNKVRNAVHCTDLPHDGKLEVEYFFRILDR